MEDKLRAKVDAFVADIRATVKEELLAKLIDGPPTEVIQDWGNQPRADSKAQHRKNNATSKEKLIALLKRHPNRGFTSSDLQAYVKGVDSRTLLKQMQYLVAARFAEKVGSAWRLRKAEKKIKVSAAKRPKSKAANGNGSHDKTSDAARQARILDIIGKNPVSLSGLRKLLQCDWYDMQDSLKALRAEGSVKDAMIPGKNSRGATVKTKRLVLSGYNAEA